MDIALTLQVLSKVPVSGPEGSTPFETVAAFNRELGSFGYTLSGKLFTALTNTHPDNVASLRNSVHRALFRITGSNLDYKPLFANFPHYVPSDVDFLNDRLFRLLQDEMSSFNSNEVIVLDCGHVVDADCKDHYNACPICLSPSSQLAGNDTPTGDEPRHIALKVIDALDNVGAEISRLVMRPSSLTDDEKKILNQLVQQGEVPALEINSAIYKENLPFVYRMVGAEAVKPAISGATDILRIAAYISDEKADLTLKEKIGFRLPNADRRALLELVDSAGKNIAEDLLRHRGLWLSLSRLLKPCTPKNAARYPNAAAAFGALRNSPKSIQTFNRSAEKVIRDKNATGEDIANALKSRAGEFGRKIDLMLRRAQDPQVIIDILEKDVASKMAPKTLLELAIYFSRGLRSSNGKRAIFPKGNVNRMKVLDDSRGEIPEIVQNKVAEILIAAYQGTIKERNLEPLDRVFIDPSLRDIVLPINARGASSVSVGNMVSKGSAIPFDAPVLRAFIYWHETPSSGRVDLDISAAMLSENFEERGTVYFGGFGAFGDTVTFSGDITSAPRGASEFIDIKVADFVAQFPDTRYIAISAYSYTGQKINDYTAFGGFMGRDKAMSGEVYDPATVAHRFNMQCDQASHHPYVIDIVDKKIIYIDMPLKNRYSGASVTNGINTTKVLTEIAVNLRTTKPTAYDVAVNEVIARGGTILDLREDIQEGDLVLDAQDGMRIANDAAI